MRSPGGAQDGLDAVLVIGTLGAPRRHRLRGRRGREVEAFDPSPVPITRTTVVRPQPFPSTPAADAWLDALRADEDATHAAVETAIALVNRAVHAYRIAAADATVTPVAASRALVARIGYGDGHAVAEGRAQRAWELAPDGSSKRLRSMAAPDERFASILAGRGEALACEELVLRAAADLRAGREREAALEARVAVEALLSELPEAGESLVDARGDAAAAANAALRGSLDTAAVQQLRALVDAMERVLRSRRLGT